MQKKPSRDRNLLFHVQSSSQLHSSGFRVCRLDLQAQALLSTAGFGNYLSRVGCLGSDSSLSSFLELDCVVLSAIDHQEQYHGSSSSFATSQLIW